MPGLKPCSLANFAKNYPHQLSLRAGDLVVNTFAYHFTPAGSMIESGAIALGCTVVPTGTGQTEMQVAAIADLSISGYIGTPSFLKLIVDKADELKIDISCLKKAIVGAEYLPPTLRKAMGERGIRMLQTYGTADLGLIAYETAAPEGSANAGSVNEGMIIDEGLLVEIVRPGTGDPVAPGEVGEVVVTTFNQDYPLVRFGTGDLSAILAGESPCGRTNMRIKGWMGRADQTTKVKGMFVRPEQIAEIAKRHPELGRLRLAVTRDKEADVMTLNAEAPSASKALHDAVAATLAAVTKLKGNVTLVAPGSLPNDGKAIADERTG